MTQEDQFDLILNFIKQKMIPPEFKEMVARLRKEGDSLPSDEGDYVAYLAAMRTWGRLNEIEQYLREKFSYRFEPNSLSDESNSPRLIPALPRIPFANREDEIRLILSSFAPAYYLLDAPAGYGKTELLKELEQRFKELGWDCAYVSVDERSTLADLVTALAENLEVSPLLDQSLPLRLRLGSALHRQWRDIAREGTTKEGLTLLIDIEKRPSLSVVKKLLQELIPAIHENLHILEFFSGRGRHNHFRVILAGRYLAASPEIKAITLPLTDLRLSPFDHDVIRDSAREYLIGQNEQSINQLSAHLFYLTAGHPGCMAQILKMYEEIGLAPDPFLENFGEAIWRDIVRKFVEEVRDGILTNSRELHKVFNQLSVFRYVDYVVLKQILDNDVSVAKDEFDLADKLTATYLFDWKGRFLRDDITRRLLAIGLRHERPQEFSELCRQAQEICAKRLRQSNVQRPEMWMIEYLFQSLQQHANVILDPAQRLFIRDTFLNEDVSKALRMLVDDRNIPPENRREEQNALTQAMEEDWEFRFTVNYYLRKDQYTNEPFSQLQQQIALFFVQQ